MKVSVCHDGSGNFMGNKTATGADDSEGMRLMFAHVAEGIGQAMLFAAGRRSLPIGKCIVSVEGDADQTVVLRDGLSVTVEAASPQNILEVMVEEALACCFPEGTLACPLRHTTITIT